jgi:hypothetical protein
VVTNVHHYLNLQDISIILLENENVISQQTQLNSFLMSQPDATIVYDKEDSISENRLILFNSAVKDMLGICLSTDCQNFDDIL